MDPLHAPQARCSPLSTLARLPRPAPPSCSSWAWPLRPWACWPCRSSTPAPLCRQGRGAAGGLHGGTSALSAHHAGMLALLRAASPAHATAPAEQPDSMCRVGTSTAGSLPPSQRPAFASERTACAEPAAPLLPRPPGRRPQVCELETGQHVFTTEGRFIFALQTLGTLAVFLITGGRDARGRLVVSRLLPRCEHGEAVLARLLARLGGLLQWAAWQCPFGLPWCWLLACRTAAGAQGPLPAPRHALALTPRPWPCHPRQAPPWRRCTR